MRKILIGVALAASSMALIGVDTAEARGAAICIAKKKNVAGNWYDAEYFTRFGGNSRTTGWDAEKAAREDVREEYGSKLVPYCRHTGRKLMEGGHLIVMQGGRKKDYAGAHYNRWALGFGATRAEAIRDAKKELMRRDWSWSESKHGYKIKDDNEF